MIGPELIPVSWLLENFRIDEDSKLWWIRPRGGRNCGLEAGGVNDKGYRVVSIKWNGSARNYRVHRVMWAMRNGAWPEGEIDHINRNRLDNRPENMRDVPRAVNGRNLSLSGRNKYSGCRNVQKADNKWLVQLSFPGKVRKSFGRWEDLEFADLVAQEARRKYYGELAV